MSKNPLNRLPAFVFGYPFNVLLIARLFAVVCNIAVLFIWYAASEEFAFDHAFTAVAVADLVALLFVLISLWFTVQKFFYVKLDAIFTSCSLVCLLAGLASAASIRIDPKNDDLLYIIICHVYLFVAQFFSLVFTLLTTRNTVSRLFIVDWGAATTQNEIELLERDF
ncbi:Protein F57B1.5 [Aphelenchoides fujianensis]|nr:Protein F57B1.5 [Aphelenchoides fujianensis]